MKKIFSILTIAFALTSCGSEFLDINDDPNKITSASNDDIMPVPEMNLAATYAVGFNVLGGYAAEVYGQNAGCSNYLKYSQFEVTATNSNSSWMQLYSRGLQQLEVIRKQSDNEPGSYLAATVLRAFIYQMLVDAYGEVPYSEALDPGNTQPKYDEGKDVYTGIIEELKAAKAKASAGDYVAKNILFGKTTAVSGTAGEWIKFANAVLLKLYMRMGDTAGAGAIINEGNFPTNNIGYDQCWGNASGSYSPLYAESKTISQDMCANYALTSTVNMTKGDARLFYKFAEGDKGMIGTVSGTNLSSEMPSAKTTNFAQPAYAFDMPVWLWTIAEQEFFIAEYYNAQGNASAAQNHYTEAIAASCSLCGCPASAEAILAAYPFSIKNLAVQKWIHLGAIMNGFESWCEVRRLGYPAFSDVSAQDIIDNDLSTFNSVGLTYEANTLYTPKNVHAKVGQKTMLQRFNYASGSVNYNNNTPATKNPTEKVFWAK